MFSVTLNIWAFVSIGLAVTLTVGLLFANLPIAFGAKNKAQRDQNYAAIGSLMGELTAAKSKIERLDQMLTEKQRQIDSLQSQVNSLKSVVTSRDIIIAGFTELGVDPKKLGVHLA